MQFNTNSGQRHWSGFRFRGAFVRYQHQNSLRGIVTVNTSLPGLLGPIALLLALFGAPATVFAELGQATNYLPPFIHDLYIGSTLTTCRGIPVNEFHLIYSCADSDMRLVSYLVWTFSYYVLWVGHRALSFLIATASPGLFQFYLACGEFYRVTCKEATSEGANAYCTKTPTVVVRVVDLYPNCSEPEFVLSSQAFSRIGCHINQH